MHHHRGTGADARTVNRKSLGPVVKFDLLWVGLYSANLSGSTLLSSLGQPELSSTPSKFFLFKTGVLGCTTVV